MTTSLDLIVSSLSRFIYNFINNIFILIFIDDSNLLKNLNMTIKKMKCDLDALLNEIKQISKRQNQNNKLLVFAFKLFQQQCTKTSQKLPSQSNKL